MQFSITKQEFIIDGRPQPLVCGEVHYFRMPRASWEAALDRLVQAGCNAVAYYVPWFVHEPEEGVFDFSGRLAPEHDLHAWVQLTAQRGLIGLLRPGPYVYAETADLGLPRWFTAKYPDAHPTRFENGEYRPYGFVRYASHNSPDFLACTRRWYAEVMRQIRGYLAPAGNVWMIQLCNEIPGDDHMDENPRNLGIGQKDGLFPRYLRTAYGSAAALSQAYGAQFGDLAQVLPHQLAAADRPRWEQDKRAYYYTVYYPEYFRRLREYLGPLPAEVTLFHNAYNPKAISLHRHNQQQNPWLNIGVDNYYSLTGSLSLKEGVYFCEYGASYSAAMLPQNPPWVIEQECGYWHDFPQVYGPELYIWNIWTFAAGWRGINMYLFAAGENTPGMGFFGSYHGWQAPVDQNGCPAPSFAHIQKSLADIRRDFAVFSAPAVQDVALGVPAEPGLIWTPLANACREAFFALRLAGFSPRVVDYEAMSADELCALPAMWLVCGEWMPRAVQEKLAGCIRRGLRLVLNGRVPHLDEHRRPCTVLAQALGLESSPCAFGEQEQQKAVWDGTEYFLGQAVQPVRGGQTLAVCPDGRPAAVRCGQCIAAPFAVNTLFFSMGQLAGKLLAALDVHPCCRMGRYLVLLPKQNGRTVVLNPHPCAVTETVTAQGRTLSCTLEPYSYQIL